MQNSGCDHQQLLDGGTLNWSDAGSVTIYGQVTAAGHSREPANRAKENAMPRRWILSHYTEKLWQGAKWSAGCT